MTTLRTIILFSFALLLATVVAAQGNHLTLGIDPGQTTTGTASNGSPGKLGITIGGYGYTPIDVPPGTDSTGIATAAAAALTAQGFAVTQNGTEVTVTAGPGGAPLLHGGGIGSTDTGINGVRAKVEPAPAPPPVPLAPAPAVKQNGGQIKKANPLQQAQQPGQIQIDVEVRKLVGGSWITLWIQIVVQVLPGDNGQTVNDRVRQQLEQQGLIVNDITLPTSVAPITPAPAFGLDRTQDGGKVQGVSVGASGGANQVLDSKSAGAGQAPDAGATDYDRSIDQDGEETGGFAFFAGDATIGQGGTVELVTDPNQFQVWIVGGGPGGLLQAPLLPLPFVGPDFTLPLDPFGALLLGGVTDPLGHATLALPIPPDPLLAGLELQLSALVIDPFAPSLFDGAQRSNGLTVRVGN